jgi:hypothetical protein
VVAVTDPLDDPIGVRAARSVLLEVLTILGEVADAITVVGGSVPPLIVEEPDDDRYVGTLDVDIALDAGLLNDTADEVYATVAEHLERRDYKQVDPPFRWVRTVEVDGQEVEVYLDLLATPPEQLGKNRRTVAFQEQGKARRLDGGAILADLRVATEVEGVLPDGRNNRKTAFVAAAGAHVVLKALAIDGRDKPKDSYDIDYVLTHVAPDGQGPRMVAAELAPYLELPSVDKALAILADKFDSADSYGPQSVALYRRLAPSSDEANAIQARAFALVQELLEELRATQS